MSGLPITVLILTIGALGLISFFWRRNRAVFVGHSRKLDGRHISVSASVELEALREELLWDRRRDSRERHEKRVMAIIVSGVFGLLSVYVILSRRYDAQTLFAYTTIGAITGYWLRN